MSEVFAHLTVLVNFIKIRSVIIVSLSKHRHRTIDRLTFAFKIYILDISVNRIISHDVMFLSYTSPASKDWSTTL